jgi:hypothetical protein
MHRRSHQIAHIMQAVKDRNEIDPSPGYSFAWAVSKVKPVTAAGFSRFRRATETPFNIFTKLGREPREGRLQDLGAPASSALLLFSARC